MKSEVKYIRKKVSVALMFKDINVEDTYFDTKSVIHDLTIMDPTKFRVPLAYYVNMHLTWGGKLPEFLGDSDQYSIEYVHHIHRMMDFFKQSFEWKKRKVRLVVVERCPWVYKKIERLVEITDLGMLITLWGIFNGFQSNNKDFVFSILRPITLTKKSCPAYPFLVVYNKDENTITYIKP